MCGFVGGQEGGLDCELRKGLSGDVSGEVRILRKGQPCTQLGKTCSMQRKLYFQDPEAEKLGECETLKEGQLAGAS